MLYLRVHLITCARPSFLRGTCARLAWASVELHVLILTNFHCPCLCSVNTGHAACPLPGISGVSVTSARVLMEEHCALVQNQQGFLFTHSSSWISPP